MARTDPVSESLREAYRGLPVAVIGGAGFIGSHLVHELIELAADVVVLDDLSTGTRSNLEPHLDRIRLVEGSMLDVEMIDAALAGRTIVFHEAAMTSVPGSVDDPVTYFETNALGTTRVLEASHRADVRRVVYAGSSSAYGDSGSDALAETLMPMPMSPYAVSKLAGEHMLAAFATCYELSAVTLRYFNVFGPRQQPDSPYAAVIARFAVAMLRGERMTIYGDGTQTRDFTYVANVVRANLLAGVSEQPLRGEILNIACGHAYSVLELVETMGRLLGVEPACDHAPPRTGEILHSHADITAARRCLEYVPSVDLETGLRETLAYYRSLVTQPK